MGLIDKIKLNTATQRLLEEEWYDAVVAELDDGVTKGGIWAKALEKSKGDEIKTKALYITYRIQSMKDEAAINLELESERAAIDLELESERQEFIAREMEKVRQSEREARQEIEREEDISRERSKAEALERCKDCVEKIKNKGYDVSSIYDVDTTSWFFDIKYQDGLFVKSRSHLNDKELCEFADTALNKKQSLFSSSMPFIIGGVIGFTVVFLIMKLL